MAETTFKRLSTTARFVKVDCGGCGHTMTIFARAATKVDCPECSVQVVAPTGGLAHINGSVVEEL